MIASRDFLLWPMEALVFGPPRSASAGESHRVDSQFPPSPRAFQGLLRTRLLLGADPRPDLSDRAVVADLVGSADRLPPGWQLRGPLPGRVRPGAADGGGPALELWVPAPRFLLGRKHDSGATPVRARPLADRHGGLSDLPATTPGGGLLLGAPHRDDARPIGGWIDPANLRAALSGRLGGWRPEGLSESVPPFVKREMQPGLAMEAGTGTARSGMLYFANALRFCQDGGLWGRLDGPLARGLNDRALEEGAGSAGRKSRLVRFEPAPPLDPVWSAVLAGDHLPPEPGEEAPFWLVQLTPAADAGGFPALRNPEVGPVRIVMLGGLPGPALTLGGFDLAGGRPRSNRPYHPAGSAWLIRLDGGGPADRRAALDTLHDRHPLGEAAEAAMGFGHTLVGMAETKEETAT